ncbi:phenylacetyl-CoA ligase, putative [Talaromyces stipitatus ATCC 10500]|uniref:Phenylacetyl-CoA ligase, putative n=1 Tax=Talaromyces stipitatus (strain ATCC 10500 / CBS 375.48 / QM 6759 / NRRL 1006) TaxID=441959 RepID=B8LZD0_TALSN|nr:phenylacetyl-CoA ligase, putative [Talaromyces stipitatus ATCC 10500]EED21683.1 phenylacetyl-CoA ligase, putative [Talaromyces stipitatus ATCC 10500]
MPVKSPYPDFEIPDVDIWSFLFERKDRAFPDDKNLFVDADTQRSYTFAQLRETALSFGHGLKATWDWKKGDVLAIFSPNCVDTPAVMYGVAWTGGVISPANPTYTVEELAFQLGNSEAKALATQRPLLPIAREAAKKVGLPEDRIILIGDERDPSGVVKHFTSIRNISGTSRFRRPKIDPKKDVAYLVYSSGTTGLPKGVMLSHRNMVSNILQGKNTEGRYLSWNDNADGQGDRILAFLPFFHIYGLTTMIHFSLFTGLTVFVMPRFDIEKFCKHVQNYRITFVYVAPPVILLLGKHPIVDKYDLSSLRMMNSGAAPLTRELVEATSARIKVGIKQGYGLSETSPTTHTQAWEDWNKDIGSVGQLVPNMEAKYMTSPEDDSEPQEVAAGEVGELWVRGPNVFLGYHKNQKATEGCLTADGWFRTGDVGYQDKDHKFYITDRVKELIKYKGFQVPPAELEGILVDSELIDDVAVIGVHSDEHGSEVPRAYVVRSAVSKASGASDAEEAEKIVKWMHSKVAQHKRLRGGVRFVETIPKSVSGKILRRVLKEQAKKEAEKPKAKL